MSKNWKLPTALFAGHVDLRPPRFDASPRPPLVQLLLVIEIAVGENEGAADGLNELGADEVGKIEGVTVGRNVDGIYDGANVVGPNVGANEGGDEGTLVEGLGLPFGCLVIITLHGQLVAKWI